MFKPRFALSPDMTRALMAIEADRQAVLGLPMDVEMIATLRSTAKLLSTHFSTQIEGNRLTQSQVAETLSGSRFPGRERDADEVRNYYAAIEWVEQFTADSKPLTESSIKTLHGLVLHGRPKPTPYRGGQNVIRDSGSGALVYLPPEAKDVPVLMKQLFQWLSREIDAGAWPIPLIAGLAHYQYATIHPYYDGNGRTARLFTTLILHAHGYGLKGIYALEEYYARDLSSYYKALSVGPSHNYYLGREEADVSPFLEYFLNGMADAFARVRIRADEAATRGTLDQSNQLRQLDPKQREAMTLFCDHAIVSVVMLAKHIGLRPRTVRSLAKRWLDSGFLMLADPSRRNRLYRLAPAWERLAAARD